MPKSTKTPTPQIRVPTGIALTRFDALDTFGKTHDKAGQPRVTNAGKPCIMVQVAMTKDGVEYRGNGFLVPPNLNKGEA